MAYLVKRGKYYHLYYYDSALSKLKTRSLKTTDRATARRELKKFEAKKTLKLDTDNFVPVSEFTLTLTQALDMYFATRRLAPKTEVAYQTAVKRLIGVVGNIAVGELTPRKYLEFITALNSENLSKNRFNSEVQ